MFGSTFSPVLIKILKLLRQYTRCEEFLKNTGVFFQSSSGVLLLLFYHACLENLFLMHYPFLSFISQKTLQVWEDFLDLLISKFNVNGKWQVDAFLGLMNANKHNKFKNLFRDCCSDTLKVKLQVFVITHPSAVIFMLLIIKMSSNSFQNVFHNYCN